MHGWEEETLSPIWNTQLQRHQQAKPGGGEIPILSEKLRVRREVLFTEWSQRHKSLAAVLEDMTAGWDTMGSKCGVHVSNTRG